MVSPPPWILPRVHSLGLAMHCRDEGSPQQGDWPTKPGLPHTPVARQGWNAQDSLGLSKPVPTQASQPSGELLVCQWSLGQTACDLSEPSLGEVTHSRQLLARRVSAQASWSDPQLYIKTPLLTSVMWSPTQPHPPAQEKRYLHQTKSYPS